MTKYFLRSPILGKSNLIEITEERFAAIDKSHKVLFAFVNVTENYLCTLNAFNSMEVTQFKIIQRDITTQSSMYTKSLYNRAKLISCIQSYLSNARYFIDTTGRILKGILSDDDFQKYERNRHELYDNSPSYRFVEELRNYSQHRSRPFDFVAFHAGMDDKNNPDTSGIAYALTLSISKAKLAADDKFKRAALEDMPEKINVCHSIRGHMSCIWQAYNYIYAKHSSLANDARSLFSEALEEVKAKYAERIIALDAVAAESDSIVQSIPILLEWDDARISLHKTIQPLMRLEKRYATFKLHE